MIANLRHQLAYLPLYLITKAQKKNFKLAQTVSEIKHVLKLSNKGSVIEEKLATPAWRPVISIESINGPLWLKLKSNYLKFVQNLPNKAHLTVLSSTEINNLIINKIIIDSRQISISIVKIFLQWIFIDDKNVLEKCNDQSVLEDFYQSSLEFRKEIALKGKADWHKKIKPISLLIEFLKMSKYSDLFDDWSQPEHFSVVMQPFLISPMINFSDIAISIKNLINNLDLVRDKNFYEYCLFIQHPFPILERFDPNTNTQYFVDFRSLSSYDFNEVKSFLFGLGDRACQGRPLAKEILEIFFNKEILLNNLNIFKPEKNHFYSGRSNDTLSFHEGVYQLKLLIKILIENFS